MATVGELVNIPIEIELGGKKHQFKRLSISDLFGKFEGIVHSEWLLRIREIADTLSLEERTDYLAKVTSYPPSGNQLALLVKTKLNSTEGIGRVLDLAHVKENSSDILPDIEKLMENKDEQTAIKTLMDSLAPQNMKVVKAEGEKGSPLAQ
jgi:hypothetical protein